MMGWGDRDGVFFCSDSMNKFNCYFLGHSAFSDYWKVFWLFDGILIVGEILNN